MAGFMNDELKAIRDSLECGHCKAIFKGSDSQARKVKYENKVVYCSSICRAAAQSQKGREQAIREGKKPRKGVLSGPCNKCGEMFESRVDKKFCSMDCYIESKQFMKMQKTYYPTSKSVKAKAAKKMRKGINVPCTECGEEFYQKNSRPKKFCSKPCARAYHAKRFDRWVANPQRLALPQCYDEFLNSEELNCLVDGCNWRGRHLALHMNLKHGVKADEFKRAAGFNLSTGVISKPLALTLRERCGVGFTEGPTKEIWDKAQAARAESTMKYRSLESREHAKKTRAIIGKGPLKECAGCKKTFQQSTPMGRAKYCSIKCRDNDYAEKRMERAKVRVRQEDGTFKWLSRDHADQGGFLPTSQPMAGGGK